MTGGASGVPGDDDSLEGWERDWSDPDQERAGLDEDDDQDVPLDEEGRPISGTGAVAPVWQRAIARLIDVFITFNVAGFLAFLVAAFVVGVFAASRSGRALGAADHGAIVWDEIVPFWLVLLMTPEGFLWQLAAFIWFRFFDITKPQPARWIDGHMKHGFGVMLDDLVAAGYTLLVLALFKVLFNG